MLVFRCCVVLFVLPLICSAMVISYTDGEIPVLEVSGTHYEVGLDIGKTFRDRIVGYVKANTYLHNTLIPFSNTTNGAKVVHDFTQDNLAAYPEYMAELQGISTGSGVPIEWIVLLNLQYEISLLHSKEVISIELSCTDLLVHAADEMVVGHNEDGAGIVKQYAYIVRANFTGPKPSSYTAYTYPCLLAGNAFGFNDHLTFSTNALFPEHSRSRGLSRNFVNRDIYSASSVNDAISRATAAGLASGFSLNLGRKSDNTLLNLEVGPGGEHSVHVVQMGSQYAHVNMYRHMNIEQRVDTSSVHRLARYEQLAPVTVATVPIVLGDTHDKSYPIYRDGTPPDGGVTTATALFKLHQGVLEVYTANPALDHKPTLVFSL